MASSSLDTKNSKIESLHIVVFPWLAFGHMLPYLELSKSLAKKGHHISYISTPRNIHRLPKLPPHLSHLIHYIPFPLPPTPGLPPHAEATSDLPPRQVPHLKTAFDALQQPFSEFIKSTRSSVDWIILDFAPHWAPPIASRADLPFVYFSIYPASSLVFFGCTDELAQLRTTAEQFAVPPPWVPFHSNIAFRLHEARRLFEDSYETNSSGVTDIHRFLSVVKASKAVAVRSSNEMESNWVSFLAEIIKKSVIPVGLLPPQSKVTYENEQGSEEEKKIFEWLDEQKPESVLYIAFGSEAELTDEETHKLALGLKLSTHPFLWAIRRPTVGMFPEGFEKNITSRGSGLIVKGWVPQTKILAHGSVGGFLTHSGWSSVIESLQFGHPLVLFPVAVDQGLISRVLVEKGVGVEVERDGGDGSFSEEEVAKAVRVVMMEAEGESLRRRAKEWRRVVVDEELQDKYIDGFVEYLESNTERGRTPPT